MNIPKGIADIIHAHKRAKDSATVARTKVIRLAVELGLDQSEATKSIEVPLAYLDGYLAGMGHLESWKQEIN